MHTTWNTLQSLLGTIRMANAAVVSWKEQTELVDLDSIRLQVAALMRKIDFPNGDYQNSGWKRKFI
jgi:hypothetical protein